MPRSIPKNERTIEQLTEHYQLEKRLANRLKKSSREKRISLYKELNDEVFTAIPNHPLLTKKIDPKIREGQIRNEMKILIPFLTADSVYLEIGAGDCALACAVARKVKSVFAIEISEEITRQSIFPPNAKLILSNGLDVSVADGSVDVCYSSNVMEHIHPDDAVDQLSNIVRSLRPGGVYICVTPNRLFGPFDISKYFDNEATCFHLKEYTYSDLSRLLKLVGFSRTYYLINIREKTLLVPIIFIKCFEWIVKKIPRGIRLNYSTRFPFKLIRTIRIMGTK